MYFCRSRLYHKTVAFKVTESICNSNVAFRANTANDDGEKPTKCIPTVYPVQPGVTKSTRTTNTRDRYAQDLRKC